MAYRLEHLDQLVMAATWGSQGEQFSLSAADIDSILHEVLEETEKLKKMLVQEVFQFTKEKEIEIYIKNYQLAATHLLDRLYSREQKLTTRDKRIKQFYQSFDQSILSLLSFIEERFSKYFDKNEKVADVYLFLTREVVKKNLTIIHSVLDAHNEPTIASELLQRLENFTGTQLSMMVTYRDIMFYKELVKELEDTATWKTGTNSYSGLQQLLIYLNYNDAAFINGMVNKIVSELQGLDDLNDKIDRLLLYSKNINQLQIKPDSSLLPRHPSVKTQLTTWYAEELNYLERKLAGLATAPLAHTDSKSSAKQKIVCHVPVDQLGIFFRAAGDLHIIIAPSQKALFEQMAPWIATPHRNTLSADSMRSKSYSAEKKDVEAVKDILMQLFRQVGKY